MFALVYNLMTSLCLLIKQPPTVRVHVMRNHTNVTEMRSHTCPSALTKRLGMIPIAPRCGNPFALQVMLGTPRMETITFTTKIKSEFVCQSCLCNIISQPQSQLFVWSPLCPALVSQCLLFLTAILKYGRGRSRHHRLGQTAELHPAVTAILTLPGGNGLKYLKKKKKKSTFGSQGEWH